MGMNCYSWIIPPIIFNIKYNSSPQAQTEIWSYWQDNNHGILELLDRHLFQSTNHHNVSSHQIQLKQDISQEKYRFPAVIQSAIIHRNTQRFGYNPRNYGNDQKILCACCQQNVNTEGISFSYPTTDIDVGKYSNTGGQQDYKLLSCVSLFFGFIKMILSYFLIKLIILDSVRLLFNYFRGRYCQIGGCQRQLLKVLSTCNLYHSGQEGIVYLVELLNLILIIISVPFFIYYRKLQYSLYDQIDRDIQTEDDYGLFVQNIQILDIPTSKTNDEQLQFTYKNNLQKLFTPKLQHFRDSWEIYRDRDQKTIERSFYDAIHHKPQKNIIRSINLCYNLIEVEKIKSFKQQLIAKHQQTAHSNNPVAIYTSQQYQEQSYNQIQSKIKYLIYSQILLSKKYAQDNSSMFNMTHFLGCAFISFQYQHYRQYLIRQYQKNPNFLGNKNLKLSRAPNPNEIAWKNLRISKGQRFGRVVISYCIMFMTLTFAFGSLLGLDILKSNNTSNKSIFDYIRVLMVAIVVLIINKALIFIIGSLTRFQKHYTKTNQTFSLITKLVISQFTNNAMIYFIISRVKNQNSQQQLLGQSGLVIKVTLLIIISCVIEVILNILQPLSLIRKFKLWYKYRNLSAHNTVNLYQLNLNKQFELIQFNLAQRYAYYLVEIYTASFYCYLVPISTPVLLVNFFLHYWIDKYNLFLRSSLKYEMKITLSRWIFKLFQISILISVVGNLVFSYYLNNLISSINFISFAIATVYISFIVFSSEETQRKILDSNETYESCSYTECIQLGRFDNTFWKSNPATSLAVEKESTGYNNQMNKKNTIYRLSDKQINKTRVIRNILIDDVLQ